MRESFDYFLIRVIPCSTSSIFTCKASSHLVAYQVSSISLLKVERLRLTIYVRCINLFYKFSEEARLYES